MSKPTGLLIGPPSKPWRIGKELGSGACGSVHLISRDGRSGASSGDDDNYCVKIAPIPPTTKKTTSSKSKKKKTPLERNADLLYHENTLYRNVLNDLRGTAVPEVPQPGDGGPPGYGDIDGYRFLCMEKMAGPISDVIPTLLSSSSSTKKSGRGGGASTIDLGPIASRMISHVESLHAKRLLFIDVKAENFMLAAVPYRKPKKSAKASDILADRVRMIDFGLVESYRDIASGKHREDLYPGAQFVGTPEYASINVLSGHTASRRDDLEAVGYVVADLIIQADGGGGGAKKKGKKSSSEGVFPWSSCRSDEEVLRVKIAEVEGSSGGSKKKTKKSAGTTFFASMGTAEETMREYFEAVRDLDYSEKPDYDALMDIFDSLPVKVGASAATAAASASDGDKKRAAKPSAATARKRPSPDKESSASSARKQRASTRTSSRRGRGSVVDDDDDSDVEYVYDEDVPPTESVPKRRKGRATRASRRHEDESSEDDSDVVMIDISDDDDDDEDDYHTCNSAQQMDWEVVEDENEVPPARPAAAAAAASASSSDGKGTLQVHVIAGKHKGESFGIGGDFADTITVGKNPPKPRNSSSNGIFKLGKERDASASHVKLALSSNRGSHSVRVTDLKASAGVLVNGKEVPSGKYKQAFIGSKITIGGSVLQIKGS